MLSQYSGTDLAQSPEKFDYFADRFEQMPMYFQTYFGSTEADRVISMIEYSIYAYDIGHVVIDNLQFMLSGQGRGFERYELQDDVISKFRNLATTCNVHITLVIHPRKGEDNVDLSLHSVFGTAKSTQEADNVLILQHRPKYTVIDVKKNRFDGEVGKVSLWFDRASKRFEQMGTKEIEALIGGRDVSEVLEDRKSRIPQDVQDKELEIKDFNYMSTPTNAGLQGHTGRSEDLSDYSKNARSGGIGMGSMESKLNKEILELFDSETLQSEDFAYSPNVSESDSTIPEKKSTPMTVTTSKFNRKEHEHILKKIMETSTVHSEEVTPTSTYTEDSYEPEVAENDTEVINFTQKDKNDLGEFNFIEQMLEDAGIDPELSASEQTLKVSDINLKVEDYNSGKSDLEKFKEDLFEPKFEEESLSTGNLDSTLNQFNMSNTHNAKKVASSPFDSPVNGKAPKSAPLNKLQGFHSNKEKVSKVDTMYSEEDETLFTFGDIIDELTQDNRQKFQKKKTVDPTDPFAPSGQRRKFVDRKTFESKNTLDLSMNIESEDEQ